LALWRGLVTRSDGSGADHLADAAETDRGAIVTSHSGFRRWLAVYAGAAYLFLYAPLFALGVFSFNSSKAAVWQGFTTIWYRQIFRDNALAEGTVNSLVIAAVATAFATVIGTLAAYALWKRGAPLFTDLLYVSLITPEIVTGVSLLAFYQWLFRVLHVQLGMHTVILAHISFSLPYVVLVILARLRISDRSLEEAAVDLGATHWQAFRHVTLPSLLPGIVAAALLCFAVSFDDYVITSLVAGVNSETLPMIIYAMARKGVSPNINALSLLITLALGAFILAAGRLERPSPARLT
jgi:spermidine/putrescine transport system permease protein